MSKSLRLSEKWFHRGLWLVALVFASFLIGLGGTVVDDLPKVEKQLELNDFMDKTASDALRNTIKASDEAVKEATGVMEQSRLKRQRGAIRLGSCERDLQQLASHSPRDAARRPGCGIDSAHPSPRCIEKQRTCRRCND